MTSPDQTTRPGAACACLLALMCLHGTARAIPLTYTDSTAFLAALPADTAALDFDALLPGTVIADGESVQRITFHYDFGGVQMQVSNVFATTSSPNFLGTTDADIFLDGDDFTMSFEPVNAIGMFFITADQMFDGDITLGAAATHVSLSVLDAGSVLADGVSFPYFLGIIDADEPFTTASITTLGAGSFLYNIDDITTARMTVAEPATIGLLGSGLIVLLCRLRRRQHTKRLPGVSPYEEKTQ